MSKGTKTILLTAAWVILTSWAFLDWRPGWQYGIPYYRETATELGTAGDKLQQQFESARTTESGVYVEQNIAVLGGVYALFAFFLLLNPEYRNGGWGHLWLLSMVLVIVIPCFVLGDWIIVACRNIARAHDIPFSPSKPFSSILIGLVTGVTWPLMTIALGLVFWFAIWIGIPLYLLYLLVVIPSILYAVLLFVVRLPILTYHHLHYLTVPHPAETAYRAGVANDLPMEELASVVADAMYMYDHGDLDALPPAWKSRNQKKRADAFKDLVNAEGPLMEAIMANLEMKDKLRERRRTTDV
jgi:hypothetical protein